MFWAGYVFWVDVKGEFLPGEILPVPCLAEVVGMAFRSVFVMVAVVVDAFWEKLAYFLGDIIEFVIVVYDEGDVFIVFVFCRVDVAMASDDDSVDAFTVGPIQGVGEIK